MGKLTIGTTRLTGFLLVMLGCRGKWYLPEPDPRETVDTGELLRIRQEMEDTGLVELDFDGKLHPTAEFARMVYNITHARGALGWKKDSQQRIYLRGPVDDLLLSCQDDLWTMELSPPSGVILWIRELCRQEEGGTLWAMNVPEDAPREVFPAMQASPEEALGELLDIYFGGGKQDA